MVPQWPQLAGNRPQDARLSGRRGKSFSNTKDSPMNKLIKLGLAAALVVGGASAAFAEDIVKTAPNATAAGSAAASTGAAVDQTTTASIGNSIDSLTTSLSANANADLSAVTDASTVNFVKVSSLSGDPAALDAALQSQVDVQSKLHASIDANAALKAKLDAAGYTSDKVLAVQTGADGAVTVYI